MQVDTATDKVLIAWGEFVSQACEIRLRAYEDRIGSRKREKERPVQAVVQLLIQTGCLSRPSSNRAAAVNTSIHALLAALKQQQYGEKGHLAFSALSTLQLEFDRYKDQIRSHPNTVKLFLRGRADATQQEQFALQVFNNITLANIVDNKLWHETCHGAAMPHYIMELRDAVYSVASIPSNKDLHHDAREPLANDSSQLFKRLTETKDEITKTFTDIIDDFSINIGKRRDNIEKVQSWPTANNLTTWIQQARIDIKVRDCGLNYYKELQLKHVQPKFDAFIEDLVGKFKDGIANANIFCDEDFENVKDHLNQRPILSTRANRQKDLLVVYKHRTSEIIVQVLHAMARIVSPFKSELAIYDVFHRSCMEDINLFRNWWHQNEPDGTKWMDPFIKDSLKLELSEMKYQFYTSLIQMIQSAPSSQPTTTQAALDRIQQVVAHMRNNSVQSNGVLYKCVVELDQTVYNSASFEETAFNAPDENDEEHMYTCDSWLERWKKWIGTEMASALQRHHSLVMMMPLPKPFVMPLNCYTDWYTQNDSVYFPDKVHEFADLIRDSLIHKRHE